MSEPLDKSYLDFIERMGSFGHSLDDEDGEDMELKHYGVLGMQWGKKKGPSSSSTKGGKIASKLDEYKKKKAENDVSNISDKELRDRINRFNMEKQYKQLSKERSSINYGSKMAKDILIGGAKIAATAYVTKYAGDNIAKMLDPVLRKG